MPVNTAHKEYNEACKKWELVRSIVNNCAKKWIRTVDRNDPSRSAQYKDDAILTNFTKLTKVGLTGLVFRKEPSYELEPNIEYLEEDATGSGFWLDQFAQQLVGEILQTGRVGVLVDYAKNAQGVAQAYLKMYTAENIINWRCEEQNGKQYVSMVVLKEQIITEGSDMFDLIEEDQYRVLLIKEGIYIQQLYDAHGTLIESIIPTDYNEMPFMQIPFEFIGSENNDCAIDPSPLYDLAVVNLGHYRNSADLEESIFITGQPFLVVNIGDTDEVSFKQANPNGLMFGSRSGLVLANGGKAELLQANANQMVSAEMKRKEEQAAALGARLISPAGGRETAEAARIRYGAQNSALYVITKNISEAIEKCLWWASCFMSEVPVESEYELNDQFYEDSADPNLIAQQIMLLDRNVISVEEVRGSLKSVGVLPEEADEEVDQSMLINPLAGVEDDVIEE